MKHKKVQRRWYFGAENSFEKEIVADIVYRREVRKQSLQKIADDLNAEKRFPRRAPKWTWATVRYFYVNNTAREKGMANR